MSTVNGIGFSDQQLAKFKGDFKRFSEKKTKKLQDATMLSAYNILKGAKERVPRYQSRLHNSLRVIQAQNRLSARVWTNVEYAPFVEFGTKSKVSIPSEIAQYAAQFIGSVKGTFKDLVDQIKVWCRRNGIPDAAAFPIALELALHGVKARPFLYPAFKAEIPKYVQAIKTIMNQEETR